MTIYTSCADLKGIRRCGTAAVRARPFALHCSVQQLRCLQPPSRGEDHETPTHQQGVKVLGVPLCHLDCRAPCSVGTDSFGSGTQSAWFFLSFCAAAVSPDLTDQFARTLKISPACGAWGQSSFPFWEGGLGLRSAARTQPAAQWASWADALKMVQERHPVWLKSSWELWKSTASPLHGSSEVCKNLGRSRVRDHCGLSWLKDAPLHRVGWQKKTGTAIEQHHHDHEVWPRLREHEQAMLRSQRGPLASSAWFDSALSACSSSADFVCPPHCSQLSVWPSTCAACATTGVLGRRGSLESAAATVCREGGARVRTNVFMCDIDSAHHDHADGRRLEVLADVLSLEDPS